MKTNSIFENPESKMLFQAAGSGNGGSGTKEHIWHKKVTTITGPYGEREVEVECLLCDDPDHWGFVVGYVDCYGYGYVDWDGDGIPDNNRGYGYEYGNYGYGYGYDYYSGYDEKCNCSCHYDSYDEDGYDGYSTLNRIAKLNSVIDPNLVCDKCGCTKNAGHEGEHNSSVCSKCGSSSCQRLRNNKKKCSFDAFEKERKYPYYNEEKMLDDMKDWSAKDENPMGGTIQRHMSYVEASGYKYADGTYAVHIDPSNTTNSAEPNITITDGIPIHTITDQSVTEYYHTHNDSAEASPDDIARARQLEAYGVTCYILYDGKAYKI